MDYRNYAIDLLKRKTQLEAAYESLGYELEMLENEKYSVSSATISPAPVSGTGGNRYENKLVNLIVLIDDARFRRKIVERELKMIEMGFPYWMRINAICWKCIMSTTSPRRP